METEATLDILKQAILLERRGMAFYGKIAEQTENQGVRDVFELMANEEQKHIHTLSEQFKAYQQNKIFLPKTYSEPEDSRVASKVLTQKIKDNIAAAGFEAAAISAAISMEEQAIKLYTESARKATDANAKALYEWLARWERGHLRMLFDIDESLKETIWFDNQFWPF